MLQIDSLTAIVSGKRALKSILIAVVMATPAVTYARDFVAFQSTTPILYRYAACVFDVEQLTAEQQIEACAPMKARLLEKAEKVIQGFHSSSRAIVRRELKKGLREIEKEVPRARNENKTVPSTIITYLNCMSIGVMGTDDYKTGAAVDYIGIETECRTQDIAESSTSFSEQELDRERILYRHFRRSGRLAYPYTRFKRRGRSRSRNRLAPRMRMHHGFLDLSVLPADDKKTDE